MRVQNTAASARSTSSSRRDERNRVHLQERTLYDQTTAAVSGSYVFLTLIRDLRSSTMQKNGLTFDIMTDVIEARSPTPRHR